MRGGRQKGVWGCGGVGVWGCGGVGKKTPRVWLALGTGWLKNETLGVWGVLRRCGGDGLAVLLGLH